MRFFSLSDAVVEIIQKKKTGIEIGMRLHPFRFIPAVVFLTWIPVFFARGWFWLRYGPFGAKKPE